MSINWLDAFNHKNCGDRDDHVETMDRQDRHNSAIKFWTMVAIETIVTIIWKLGFNGSLTQNLPLKMMAIIPQTDFIHGQSAFKPKKIRVHLKQPSAC